MHKAADERQAPAVDHQTALALLLLLLLLLGWQK
jgi:hypothetical protein